MPAGKPVRPRARPRADVPAGMPRELADAVRAVQRLEVQQRDRSVFNVDLVVGDNRINHGLGRTPTGATVTPRVADAAWAWALTSADATTCVIATIGVAQPGATVELFAYSTGGA